MFVPSSALHCGENLNVCSLFSFALWRKFKCLFPLVEVDYHPLVVRSSVKVRVEMAVVAVALACQLH